MGWLMGLRTKVEMVAIVAVLWLWFDTRVLYIYGSIWWYMDFYGECVEWFWSGLFTKVARPPVRAGPAWIRLEQKSASCEEKWGPDCLC